MHHSFVSRIIDYGKKKFETVAISGTASDFASFDVSYGVMTPIEIVCHISQLLQNYCSTIAGSPRVRPESKGWDEEDVRFYEIVEQLDQAILHLYWQALSKTLFSNR